MVNTNTMHPLYVVAALLMLAGGWASSLLSQTTGASPAPREFRLQALYRAGVAQNYEVVEQTTVERIHSDSSRRTYSRVVQYMMTVRCVESSEGIAKVLVTVDSLIYKFSAEGMEITYDSQKDITIKNFADLNNYIGPLNRSYELTITPYGEVTKISGEQIDFWRDYLRENAEDLDSVVFTIWMQSLDRENLLQYGDLQKRVIPGRKRALDSTWNHQMQLRIDGVVYEGLVMSRFVNNSGGLFTMITKDTLQPRTDVPVHVYGIPQLCQITSGTAFVDHTLLMTNNGTVDEVTNTTKAWFMATVGTEKFTHKTTSTTKWKLLGQYQW